MKWIVCKIRGHEWSRPYWHGGNFRRCRRCGKIGWEVP